MEREELKGKQSKGAISVSLPRITKEAPIFGFAVMAEGKLHSTASGGIYEHEPFIMSDAVIPDSDLGQKLFTAEEVAANATLYAEAHNVANRTGMWPLDMEQRIKALEDVLRLALDTAEWEHHAFRSWHEQARAILSK